MVAVYETEKGLKRDGDETGTSHLNTVIYNAIIILWIRQKPVALPLYIHDLPQ